MKCFRVLIAFSLFSSQLSFSADCREQLKQRVFVNGKQAEDTIYIEPFLEAFDLYPAPLQNFMCKFKHFNLVKMEASADSGMNIRKGLFDMKLTANQWATWKEQVNFALINNDKFETRQSLPTIRIEVAGKEPSFLYYLLAHELGHNMPRDGKFGKAWSKLHTDKSNQFKNSTRLCSYWCADASKQVSAAEIPQLYSDLYGSSNLPSVYATRNQEEDFADSFAAYILLKQSAGTYEISLNDGTRYFLKDQIESERFKSKLAMLAEVYAKLGPATQPARDTLDIIVE